MEEALNIHIDAPKARCQALFPEVGTPLRGVHGALGESALPEFIACNRS